MILLDPARRLKVRERFLPDRPGPLVGLHVVATGYGACLVDRWPDPAALLSRTGSNCSLAGEPDALAPRDLAVWSPGMFDAPERFVPLLEAAFPDLLVWERVILAQRQPGAPIAAEGSELRRLEKGDAHHLFGLPQEIGWISDTWGGPPGLASSATAWGVFVEGELVSVAVPFFVGERYEDIGVVTRADFRGRGLSAACAGRLVEDIRARGRVPSWSTAPENEASLRVAGKLGFERVRRDRLYVVGQPVPGSARRGG